MKMAIVHDLGEVYLGDFTPYDNITKTEKHHQERKAILKTLENLNEDSDFFTIWEEFEKSESAEAKLIKNVDSLEFLLQACAYGYDAKYFKKSLSKITEPHCKEIALATIEATKGNKKPKVVG
jgi:putative hydrolase of HD superfamily